MAPIKSIGTYNLFSALIIGYMANGILPAHLGEVVRAFVLGKRENIETSPTFATIVVERIIDVISLLAITFLTLFVYPFPHWVIQSGMAMLAIIMAIFFFLFLLKRYVQHADAWIRIILHPFPDAMVQRVTQGVHKFTQGVVPLESTGAYFLVISLSIAIWACYAGVIALCITAFGFADTFAMPWNACLVILVITTVSLMIPASPGYIGTYHYLCQFSLMLFAIPPEPALSFAMVLHGVNVFPVVLLGLILVKKENVIFRRLTRMRACPQPDVSLK